MVNGFDMIFLSYDEPKADENWQRLHSKFPGAQRVHGVRGLIEAFRECARRARSDNFFLVDADAYILDDFLPHAIPNEFNPGNMYAWRSRNAVNGLTYGNGAVKLVSSEALTELKPGKRLDVLMNVEKPWIKVENLASETRFNTSAFSAWRAGFRETVNLSSQLFNGQPPGSWVQRALTIWCTVGFGKPLGKWCIRGACEGRAYGLRHLGDFEALARFNDYGWLEQRFKTLYSSEVQAGE